MSYIGIGEPSEIISREDKEIILGLEEFDTRVNTEKSFADHLEIKKLTLRQKHAEERD